MKKTAWKKKIKDACESAGTYKTYFDNAIDTLAGIMELRDNAVEKFEALGGDTVVSYTNKNGQTNVVKNPALVVVLDCNAQALSYWRDLGLTPAGLKKLGENSLVVKKEKASFADVLGELGI